MGQGASAVSETTWPAGYHHTVDVWRREHFAPAVPRDVTLSERRLWHINPADHLWRARYLHDLPDWLAGYFARRYEQLFAHPREGRRRANAFLRQTLGEKVLPRLERVRARYALPPSAAHELPFIRRLEQLTRLDRKEVRELAARVAAFLANSLMEFTAALSAPDDAEETAITLTAYRYLAELTSLSGIRPPYWASFQREGGVLPLRHAQSGLLRMMAPEWWRRSLQRMRDRQREHLAIAAGQVQKMASAYVSRATLNEWNEQKKRNRDYFRRLDLINDRGERMAMEEVVNRSNAKPKPRMSRPYRSKRSCLALSSVMRWSMRTGFVPT